MIKLNNIFVAYNEIMVYSITTGIHYPNSNLEKYNIHPWFNPNHDMRFEIEKKYGIKFPHTITSDESEDLKNELSMYYSNSFEGQLDNSDNFFIDEFS